MPVIKNARKKRIIYLLANYPADIKIHYASPHELFISHESKRARYEE